MNNNHIKNKIIAIEKNKKYFFHQPSLFLSTKIIFFISKSFLLTVSTLIFETLTTIESPILIIWSLILRGLIIENEPGSKLVREYFFVKRYLFFIGIVSSANSSIISNGGFIFKIFNSDFSVESNVKENSYLISSPTFIVRVSIFE